jgi:small-conductance mechanosensitive channel
MTDWLNIEIAGNNLQQWLIACAVTLLALGLTGIVLRIGIRRLRASVDDEDPELVQLIVAVAARTSWIFTSILALYIGSLVLVLPDKTRSVINSVIVIAFLLQAGLWAAAALRTSVEQYRKRQLDRDPASVTTLNILNFIGRVVLWAVVLTLVLDNLGVNITALVAGLGVGGIAIALAVQTILGDLFASLSIVLDKPFVVGDFLIVDDFLGAVEHVGLKTTRLRSLSGEQLVFSNSDLLNSRIRNYGRMFERRVPFNIGVTYQTPREKLKLIPEITREAIEKQEKTRFDRSNFKEYGSYSLNFESVYYIAGPDYNLFMNIHEAVCLHIHERFEQEGIEFAYPTQVIHMAQPQPAS